MIQQLLVLFISSASLVLAKRFLLELSLVLCRFVFEFEALFVKAQNRVPAQFGICNLTFELVLKTSIKAVAPIHTLAFLLCLAMQLVVFILQAILLSLLRL